MEENKDLKKRIREVVQVETDYQDTVAGLKVDPVLTLRRRSQTLKEFREIDQTHSTSASRVPTCKDYLRNGMTT